MSDARMVLVQMLRIYRPTGAWFWSTMIVGVAIGVSLLATLGDVRYSLWMVIAGNASKYWMGAAGVLLGGRHLKQFMATGLTRRAYLSGAIAFGLVAVLVFTVLVTAGHLVEQAFLRLGGPLAATYPQLTARSAVGEFFHVLPVELAYLVTGAAITAGYYRFGPWLGFWLILPGAVPVLVAEGLFGRGPHGEAVTRLLPFGVALVLSVVVSGSALVMYHRELRDVAIRRTTG
jgi:hypothetical protein